MPAPNHAAIAPRRCLDARCGAVSVSIPSPPPRRRRRAPGIALCAILSLALCPAVASAQVSDADKATARALAQQAQDALERRDFATAADRFERAGELVHAPTLELGLARAQVGLGKWVAAHETYNRVARETLPAGAPPAFTKALGDAARELASLEPRIPTVTIVVEGAPSAKVTLDGAPVSSALLGVGRMVDPGAHTVRAVADGFAPAQSAFTVAERNNQQVTLRLERVPGAVPAVAPPPPGAAPSPAPPGAGPPPPSPSSSGSTRKLLGFVGLGVGGAGLVVGAVAGGLAVSKHASLQKVCPGGACPEGQASNLDGYHVVTALSTAGFVAGGLLAAAGVVLVVTAPRSTEPSSAGVAPVIGAGRIGVQGWF